MVLSAVEHRTLAKRGKHTTGAKGGKHRTMLNAGKHRTLAKRRKQKLVPRAGNIQPVLSAGKHRTGTGSLRAKICRRCQAREKYSPCQTQEHIQSVLLSAGKYGTSTKAEKVCSMGPSVARLVSSLGELVCFFQCKFRSYIRQWKHKSPPQWNILRSFARSCVVNFTLILRFVVFFSWIPLVWTQTFKGSTPGRESIWREA